MNLHDLPPLLLPAPRQIERGQGWCSIPQTSVVVSPTVPADLPKVDGAYALDVDATGLHLAAHTPAGARAGNATIAQLRRHYGTRMPALRIRDWPSFATRGVMLDISRDRVWSQAHLLHVIELLASLKLNHLQLYIEHSFAHAGHEAVWRDASPITPAELRELDAHAGRYGVSLSVCQNSLGHLHRFLRHDAYKRLAEAELDLTPWGHAGRGGFSLCPTSDAALAFAKNLLDGVLPCLGSHVINLGCDETFDLGTGASAAACAARGKHAVYADFVNALAAHVGTKGLAPQFWADIALEHPATLTQLDPALLALAWWYDPGPQIERACAALAAAGRRFWVCPGTSSWLSLTGRSCERTACLHQWISSGLRHGAEGMMITDWGDLGHHQPWAISLHGIAAGAAAAWSGVPAADHAAESLHLWDDRTLRTAAWVDRLGDVDAALRAVGGAADGMQGGALINSSVLYNTLLRPHKVAQRVNEAAWAQVAGHLEALAATAPSPGDALLGDELRFALDLALVAAQVGAAQAQGDGTTLRGCAGRMRALAQRHGLLWLQRSRPGGLADSQRHLANAAARMESAA